MIALSQKPTAVIPTCSKANWVPVTMEEGNYDEFGNYIGPEINDSDETNETVSVEGPSDE